jgi:hypothetical protein
MTQTQFAANKSHLNILLNRNHPITLFNVLCSYSTGFQIASFYLFNAITLTVLHYYILLITNITINFSLNSHLILTVTLTHIMQTGLQQN